MDNVTVLVSGTWAIQVVESNVRQFQNPATARSAGSSLQNNAFLIVGRYTVVDDRAIVEIELVTTGSRDNNATGPVRLVVVSENRVLDIHLPRTAAPFIITIHEHSIIVLSPLQAAIDDIYYVTSRVPAPTHESFPHPTQNKRTILHKNVGHRMRVHQSALNRPKSAIHHINLDYPDILAIAPLLEHLDSLSSPVAVLNQKIGTSLNHTLGGHRRSKQESKSSTSHSLDDDRLKPPTHLKKESEVGEITSVSELKACISFFEGERNHSLQ
jgi:hypothetical protein